MYLFRGEVSGWEFLCLPFLLSVLSCMDRSRPDPLMVMAVMDGSAQELRQVAPLGEQMISSVLLVNLKVLDDMA